jgi:hypothetical protein
MKHPFVSLLTACVLAFAACAESAGPDLQATHAKGPHGAAPLAQPPVAKLEGPMPEQLTLEYRACDTDADCVLALNGCCDCANGGHDIAVNRAKLGDFVARFQCASGCTERGGKCGDGTIACKNELCTYGSKPP